ncbi:MAG: hypothetical protein NC434_15875, partial [Ruminococcus sp.]|nr:hypothetical protein [Ruminococcus sp.]
MQTGVLPNPFSSEKNEDSKKDTESGTSEDGEDGEQADDENTDEEEDVSAALEEDLAPIAEQVSAAEEKMAGDDYAGASGDLEGVLNSYADLVKEYDSDDVTDEVSPLAETAFDLYTQSVLKQVESWESQSPTAPLHQQIIITYDAASALAVQLQEAGLTVSTDALEKDIAEFPARYKEKYILAFNDLFSEESWSRTTAWMYMQDAASVGLVDESNPD